MGGGRSPAAGAAQAEGLLVTQSGSAVLELGRPEGCGSTAGAGAEGGLTLEEGLLPLDLDPREHRLCSWSKAKSSRRCVRASFC